MLATAGSERVLASNPQPGTSYQELGTSYQLPATGASYRSAVAGSGRLAYIL